MRLGFTMKVVRIFTSAILLVASVNGITQCSADPLAAPISQSQPLINIDFGSGGGRGYSLKTGFAAIGQTTNDFWNFYDRDASATPNDWRYSGVLTNLQ